MKSVRAGFTLVELMITLVIIAIMASIGTPALLSSLPGMRVNGAVRQVLSDIRLAKTKSIERGMPVVVKFHVNSSANAATGTYVVAVDDNEDGNFTSDDTSYVKEFTIADDYANIEFSSAVSGTPSDGVDLDLDTANAITFMPNGSASENGNIYLRPAEDTGEKNRRIQIFSSTGTARVESWDGSTWTY